MPQRLLGRWVRRYRKGGGLEREKERWRENRGEEEDRR